MKTLALSLVSCVSALALFARETPPPVGLDASGALVYNVDTAGNRVPDFSHAGYGGGGVPLPQVPARLRVEPQPGDDGARIQAALDQVAALPLDTNGLRGAVLLEPGEYQVEAQLVIKASGVVLRGSGNGLDGTVLHATGTGRRALIEIAGRDGRRSLGAPVALAEDSPAGSLGLRLSDTNGLKPGMAVTIKRPSTAEWIKFMGMDDSPGRQGYQWKAGTLDVTWDRVIAAVEGDRVTLDAPVTLALEARFGGAVVQAYQQEGYLTNCGVERLRCISDYDQTNPLDEQHAWNAVDLHALRDGWIADLTAVQFAGSAVQVGAKVTRVTVQDCASLSPVSELAGYRRLAFHNRGQQVLFLRCVSEQGRNDFTTGYTTAGPNVFLHCEARLSASFSGSIGSASSGLLFDDVKIDGAALRLDNLETYNQGVGWAALNSMLWQSSAGVMVCRTPPGANNWAVAVWAQFVGDGSWHKVSQFARPESIYRAQLEARAGKRALDALLPRTYTAAPTLPSPAPPSTAQPIAEADKPLTMIDGVLLIDGNRLSGRDAETAWWRGRLEPARASDSAPAITRFAPGRTGTGLTDEPPVVAAKLAREGKTIFRHHHGLWYDRRRDDHQMVRRPDAEVFPPFFEQPFARSGQGRAWDGLSRYDLTKYNPWYFDRLRSFAREARKHGIVLLNEMYFQHNIIESGAHWVDSPWRPVNNINATRFTEPPPFQGDTIKMADEFYDLTDPAYRDLHRAYIRHHLDVLGGESNVIHTLTAENSGPLSFMQFWLDTVAEWRRETGRHPFLALSAPKDVQDAILADAKRETEVDIIDLTYWFRNSAGQEFAPLGGQSLAPRQHQRLFKGKRPDADTIAAMAREYRAKFPGKAVITGLGEAGDVQPE
jgi:hypothetical protein